MIGPNAGIHHGPDNTFASSLVGSPTGAGFDGVAGLQDVRLAALVQPDLIDLRPFGQELNVVRLQCGEYVEVALPQVSLVFESANEALDCLLGGTHTLFGLV